MSATPLRLLDENEAAAILGTSPRTLQGWRLRGEGPKFLKLGSTRRSRVRYDPSDLISWLEGQRRQFTGEGNGAAL